MRLKKIKVRLFSLLMPVKKGHCFPHRLKVNTIWMLGICFQKLRLRSKSMTTSLISHQESLQLQAWLHLTMTSRSLHETIAKMTTITKWPNTGTASTMSSKLRKDFHSNALTRLIKDLLKFHLLLELTKVLCLMSRAI